ncbi:MAG: CDP-alcohol phosphatidyltransferase family protein [Sphingomicrobium sp.]
MVVPNGEQFVRKLRRRVELGVHSLIDEPVRVVEKRLFANAYKGVTDVVTRWVWPWPAFQVTRAAALTGITPNMITFAGLALVFAAGWLFYRGDLGAALAAAWLMTFFDTVDGKLARVTSTSSKFGDILDHGTDIIHPPIWWYCLAHGLALMGPDNASKIWSAFWIILVCYVAGRAVEIVFHRIFGFNQYIWKPFDSYFRLVVSRRNTILLIMTLGWIVNRAGEAFLAAAGWTLLSLIIQLVRLAGALRASRGGPLTSWLY